jgi:hypothetical protein
MSDDQEDRGDERPRLAERGAEAKAERERRQALAMRANLRRRKQQARSRGKPLATDAG